MQIPKRKSQSLSPNGQETDNYLTAEAIEALKEELDRLKRFSRPKTVEELSAAREMGDLSENAAYTMAKGRLAGIDRRMAEIGERLKNAVIIERGAGKDGRIRVGSTVTVESNGRERIFEITGSQETDPGSGRISHHSPVGQALLNHRAKETVTVRTADGREIAYLIKTVE
ncbi:transcription elongation factor GreA [Candidatus Uhrbacteria bacterium]|nr:transcription elongation factor GreA [Candidatus Uhrbacteria bacterium]